MIEVIPPKPGSPDNPIVKPVVPDPTYYRLWDLIKAIFHKLFKLK